MNRPKGLTLTAILMALCSVMILSTIRPGRPPYTLRMWGVFTVVICIECFGIWSYWKGRGWARIGALLYSGASIFNLFLWNTISLSPAAPTTPSHIIMATRAVLGAALLFYLNTRPVLDFFYPENTLPKLGVGRILYGLWIMYSSSQTVFVHPTPRMLSVYEAHPVSRWVTMVVFVLIGGWVSTWGILAESRPPRAKRPTPAPDVSNGPNLEPHAPA
jgi:hypothetical protein